jgi:spore germination cell wall hydrolase CwlJ-like protein
MKHVLLYVSLLLFGTSGNVTEEPLIYDLPEITVTPVIDESEYQLLVKFINAAAACQDLEGKLAVANVVYNRMEQDGKSMQYILFKKDQFCEVKSKRFRHTQDKEVQKAARLAAAGRRVIGNEYRYFYAHKKVNEERKWIRQIKDYGYIRIGDHTFCKKKPENV